MTSELENLRKKNEIETKQKVDKEWQLYKQRHIKRTYYDGMHSVKLEILNHTEQLQNLKDKISKSQLEISRLRMQNSAEKAKFDTSMSFLDIHRKEFQDKFEKEATFSELRHREQLDLEAAGAEASRQKQRRIDEQNAQYGRDIDRVEEQIAEIQRECAILKVVCEFKSRVKRHLLEKKQCNNVEVEA